MLMVMNTLQGPAASMTKNTSKQRIPGLWAALALGVAVLAGLASHRAEAGQLVLDTPRFSHPELCSEAAFHVRSGGSAMSLEA